MRMIFILSSILKRKSKRDGNDSVEESMPSGMLSSMETWIKLEKEMVEYGRQNC